jgi:hypothetical protein
VGLTTLFVPELNRDLVPAAEQFAIWPSVKPGKYCAPTIALDSIYVISF